MSYQRTFPGLIQKTLAYIEESAFGTTPATSPTFITAGKIKRFSFNVEAAVERYRALGSRHVAAFIQTGQMYSFEIEYQPINTLLMQYGVNNPNSTGTIAKSLSFVYSKLINGTEYYYFLKGAKTDSITIEVTKEAVNVTQSFLCREVTTPSTTSGLLTPTFPTATGQPWTGDNGGQNAFSYGATPWETPRFSATVAWNLDAGMPNGHTLIKFLDPTNKDCNVDFDVWQKDTTFIADLKANTERDCAYTLNAASSAVLTLADFYNESYSLEEDASSNETTTEPASGGCKDITLAESATPPE